MNLEGHRFGDFEIIASLGQGGMGAVYKARQISLDRLVALKTLQPALASDADYVARFHNEARAAAALNHPNLVQVFAAGESEGLHYFAMEYVDGESAQARLKRNGRIDPAEAIAIAMHVANALDHAWKRAHLIHRDIKPDNIFLSGHGDVKLGDLGLAKRTDENQSLTMTGASMGTPHYASPEQAEGRKDIDLRADIYSLGCTLYHLLSGWTPYDGETVVAVMMKHVASPVPNLRSVWPECPAELASVVMKMMLKQPGARQQSYEELTADLRRAYDEVTGAGVPAAAFRQQPAAAAKERRFDTAGEGAGGGKTAVANRRSLMIAGPVAVLAVVGALLFFAFSKKEPVLSEEERAEKARASAKSTDGSAPQAPAPATGTSPLLGKATKDAPFVNTLGMEFVPVPGTQVLFCRWETRVKDYAAYAKLNTVDAGWSSARKDGISVGHEPGHPVCWVNWQDANAFCDWLTRRERAEGRLPEGMVYRLPTDEEWSRAVGLPSEAGLTPKDRSGKNSVHFPWGGGYPPPKQRVGNYADTAFHEKFPMREENGTKLDPWIEGYTDGFATTAPAGSFPANEYGIHDLGGNVWEWCEDLYEPGGPDRVLRGGSWYASDQDRLLSSYRYNNTPARRHSHLGFRCVVAAAAR